MKAPEIFIPKSRVELPAEIDDESLLAELTEVPLIRFGFDAISIMRLHYHLLPSWEPWHDGSGGSLKAVDRDGVHVLATAPVDELGVPTGVYSTDGIAQIHDGEPTLATFSAVDESRSTMKLFWGVATYEPEELLALGSAVRCVSLQTRNEWFNRFFEYFYPQ